MNLRGHFYFRYLNFRGSSIPQYYKSFVQQDGSGASPNRTRELLIDLLTHCQRSVPYYSQIMRGLGDHFRHAPESYLSQFPILTKGAIRDNFEQLKSADLVNRKWHINMSGGSTGEPSRFIQDKDYLNRSVAIAMLFSKWAGSDPGDSELYLWGSDRDIFQGGLGWRAHLRQIISGASMLNAFRMSPENMREFIKIINAKLPKLIVAYAQAIYELAKFAEQQKLFVVPQRAIIASASTLYPFMREQIERVFQCKVFNRYGSREAGGIASQCRFHKGLHVAPWGNYIEVVDDDGNPVPDGVEGNILITSLSNYAMPLVRYKIGDRGILSANNSCPCGRAGQIFEKVSGRVTDNFKTRAGKVIPGEYFVHLLGVVLNTQAIKKFQIIQKSYDNIVLKIVRSGNGYVNESEIIEKINLVIDEPCDVHVEFTDDILPTSSGKYLYTLSEVQA